VFKAGIVVLLITLVRVDGPGVERAGVVRSSATTPKCPRRLLHPLEFPVLGAVGLAVVIYSFSRIMLFISKEAGPAVFIVIGALITWAASCSPTSRRLKTSVVPASAPSPASASSAPAP
jgi:hypothetical protein